MLEPIGDFEGSPHILRSQQFTVKQMDKLFKRAESIRLQSDWFSHFLNGRGLAILFAEPSTRTMDSFLGAAQLLGPRTIRVRENMSDFSSEVKGEPVADTIEFYKGQGFTYFILRRKEEGSVARAAAAAGAQHPVINGGDGKGQHPTQSLLDLYTIWRECHDLNRQMSVAVVGDLLNGRTVHSLAYLLSKFPNKKLVCISPEGLRLKSDLLDHAREHGMEVADEAGVPLAEAVRLHDIDVVYMTRPQLERAGSDEEREALTTEYARYFMTPEIANGLKPEAIIMHPLPRNQELPVSLNDNPRSRYYQQMANGRWIRAALLTWIEEVIRS